MRGSIVIVALTLLAGCMDKTEAPVETASADPLVAEAAEAVANATMAAPPAPVTIEGTVWLPPTTGNDRTESLVELPVSVDGQTIRATLHLGSWYGIAEIPPVLTDVLVELRDPAGVVLAEASLTMGQTDAEVDGISPAGTAILALLSYGGSDEEGNGDHVDYVAEIA